jgi:hypothetical protein
MESSMTGDMEASGEPNPRDAQLRGRIGWICQAVRIAGVVWLLWGTTQALWIWSHRADFIDKSLKIQDVDPATISDFNYWLAFVPVLVAAAADAFMVWRLWLLMRGYLKGDIFSVDASNRLRAVALAGLVATVVAALAPPVQVVLASPALFSKFHIWQLVSPDSLLYALICGFLLALAAIFKAGAEIAEENKQFV